LPRAILYKFPAFKGNGRTQQAIWREKQILAGNFAQLPPTGGSPLYSNIVSKTHKHSMSKRDQELTIGNMASNNGHCHIDPKYETNRDLDFLKTLHVNRSKSDKSLNNPNFKNVSIITSLNT
jgi:hypothetical protein